MIAGFSKRCITPPVGTRMSGFGRRDDDHGAEAIHDDLHLRVLYLEDGNRRAAILGFDILFFSSRNAARLKNAILAKTALPTDCVLLNTSHTHAGPCVDEWSFNRFAAPEDAYTETLEATVVEAVIRARDSARDVLLQAGCGNCNLPVSRRKPDGRGGVEWRPYPEGTTCTNLPLALFTEPSGAPVCLLYAVSCHPSTTGGWSISADYPGVACDRIDHHLGAACSLFLQGAGGDTKASVIADGRDDEDVCWRSGNWDDIAAAGRIVADDVIAALSDGLHPITPSLQAGLIHTEWPLADAPSREELELVAEGGHRLRRMWARGLLAATAAGRDLAAHADIQVQGIQIGSGLRAIAIEGELVAELGLLTLSRFDNGVTFALGYSNGTGLYLPTTAMLAEGGYEAESYHEYGFPSPLAPGVENVLTRAIGDLKRRGIT